MSEALPLVALIAVQLIAAGAVAGIDHDLQPGDAFQAPADQASALIEQGLAKADESAAANPGGTPADPSTPPKPAKVKTVRLRLLTDCEHGRVNDLVTLPAKAADEAERAGLADASKEAVAYAATLAQNKATPAAD